jgi:diamine N-acetyltransferase
MILESDKIRIKFTKTEHLPKIIKIEQDNSDFIGQYNFNEHKAVIENDNELHFSIFDKSDNALIGHIILAGLRNIKESIEFRRIVVSKKGKGFGTDSMKLIKKYCFDNLNAHRIWLDVLEANFNAIKLYESQGFRIEEILRDSVKRDGKYCSLLLMSILNSEIESTEGETK